MALQKYGASNSRISECKDFFVPGNDFITSMDVSFNSTQVEHVALNTKSGRYIEKGHKDDWSSTYTIHFSKKTPLVGFYASGRDTIKSIGAYKDFC